MLWFTCYDSPSAWRFQLRPRYRWESSGPPNITAPEVGTYLYPSTTFRISNIPFEVRKPPIRLGEENDYVYREVLGLTEEEYDRLKALGHIGMDTPRT